MREIEPDGACAGRIVAIGLPAGLQGVVIALSNITIQSSVNSLGKAAMAGFGAAASLEGFVWVSMNAFTQACLTFTSCNYGAGQLRRTDGTRRWCMLLSAVTGILIGWSFFLLRRPLLGIYVSGEDAVAAGLLRMNYLMPGYFVSGVFDAMISYQRGLGSSTRPTVVSLLGMCAFRVLWVIFVFPHYHTAASLLVSYPVSWLLTLAGQTVCTYLVRRRVYAQAEANDTQSATT